MARLSEFVSVKQAAEEKGVPPDTVRRRIARGSLPATRVGEVLLIRRRDLEAWEVQRKKSGDHN